MSEKKMSTLTNDAPGTAVAPHAFNTYIKVEYNEQDKAILRKLAQVYMEYASMPVQKETAKLWQKLNDLEECRPLVWHNEIPWHEMNYEDELTCITSTEFARQLEFNLRKDIYLWKHMPGDMVLEPVIYSPMIITNSGMGIEIQEETSVTDESSTIVGHKFIPAIESEDDLEKIIVPKVTHHKEKTKETYEAYKDIFDGIAPVEIRGNAGFWYAPIDDVVQLMGVEPLLLNLAIEPDFVHKTMKKINEAYLGALDQYEEIGALATNNLNYRLGSGGYGYTEELERGTSNGMKCSQMWGSAACQFFTTVGPDMHDEFAVQYEKEWLDRHPLSYYGCCERLDNKIDVLRQIKSLRKISISPWSNTRNAAEQIGRDYVMSIKPLPAVFAYENWDLDGVEKEVRARLDEAKGCNVELIIKDISTVRYEPQRLWEWVNLVSKICKEMI